MPNTVKVVEIDHVREKLIELLKDCCYRPKPNCMWEPIADHLIAHGVTVQEWISVKDRLPDTDGNYIVTACDEGCPYGEGIWYDTVVVVAEYYKGTWTWCENGTEYDLEGIVTHWMPLPQPPKGECT